jgi:hypothetical protein
LESCDPDCRPYTPNGYWDDPVYAATFRAMLETGRRGEEGGVTGLVTKPPESPRRSVTP